MKLLWAMELDEHINGFQLRGNSKMKNILLTGINGFVGTNLYDHLKFKNEITGLDLPPNLSRKKCTMYTWDEFSMFPELDVIIHLAGMAHDTKGNANESQYFDVNVGLTQKIFEYFLSSSAQKFIFFSSVKAIADSVEGGFLTERATPKPKTSYGKSKLAAEKYLLSQPLPVNKKLYILRPAMIHGTGNKGNLNLLYSIVQKGIPYPLGLFDNRRSFTSIGNLNFIIEQLIYREVKSGIYNICDDVPLSTVKIVEMIYDALGKKRKILNIPKSFVYRIANIGDLLGLPLNSERLKKMTESYIVSNSEIKEALKVQELPVLAKDGMMLTINSFVLK